MITYNLEDRGNTPLYEYIYKCIKNDIINGLLKPGEKLPSKRSLAQNLSVSLITIENAYEQLIYEGFIYAEEKRGYYISDIPENALDSKGLLLTNTTNANNIIIANDYKQNDHNLIAADFTSNHPSSDIFPFSIWTRILRRTLLDNEEQILQKSANTGCTELRTTIADYLKSYKGMTVSPSNIIIGAGMEYLYELILQLLGRNKMIAVEDPGHTKVSKIYESNGVKVLHIPLDEHGFDPEKQSRNNVSCIHISPSHHFPTGIIMPASRRLRLIEQSRLHNFYIIEDDFDSELRYDSRPLPAMASLAPDKVIYLNTFSKTMMNTVRIAYMVLPDELMLAFSNRLGFYSCTVSSMEQLALAHFMEEGYYERLINRTRLHYKKCRLLFLDCFNNSNLSKHFQIIEHGAGLHFIIKAKNNIDDTVFINEANKKGILIHPIHDYCYRLGNEYAHSFLINYFNMEKSRLIDVFNSLCECI